MHFLSLEIDMNTVREVFFSGKINIGKLPTLLQTPNPFVKSVIKAESNKERLKKTYMH